MTESFSEKHGCLCSIYSLLYLTTSFFTLIRGNRYKRLDRTPLANSFTLQNSESGYNDRTLTVIYCQLIVTSPSSIEAMK